MNPEKPSKPNPVAKLSGNNSTAMRAVLIAGLIFGLIIIFYIGLLIFGGGNGNAPQLTTVVQDQNELVRVATLAASEGQGQSSQATKNFSQSTILSLTTEQKQLLNFMALHGGEPSSTELFATKNTRSDSALQASIQASTFDSTFTNIMQTLLSGYKSDLQSAYAGTTNVTERQLLSGDFQASKLLLQELTSPTQ